MRIPTGRVHLVPPSESHEAAPSNVFEIVKIGGEKEDGKDEYQDTRFFFDYFFFFFLVGCLLACLLAWLREHKKFWNYSFVKWKKESGGLTSHW